MNEETFPHFQFLLSSRAPREMHKECKIQNIHLGETAKVTSTTLTTTTIVLISAK